MQNSLSSIPPKNIDRKLLVKELQKINPEEYLIIHPNEPNKWLCKCCKLGFFWKKRPAKIFRHIKSERHIVNKSKYTVKLAL